FSPLLRCNNRSPALLRRRRAQAGVHIIETVHSALVPGGQRQPSPSKSTGDEPMNRIFRKIWSIERGGVVASALGRGTGKGKGARLLQAVALAGAVISAPVFAGEVCPTDDGSPASADGVNSLACGSESDASGNGATAIGVRAIASANHAVAVGYQSLALA